MRWSAVAIWLLIGCCIAQSITILKLADSLLNACP
jgi:hypothetical protein